MGFHVFRRYQDDLCFTYKSSMTDSPFVIRVENVTQRFRVIHERPDSVRELFSKFFRKKVKYHDFEAVKNASLSVRRGEVVGIIGRNGSGKSTLLKVIAGVYRPSAGPCEVTGSIAPLIELGAGMHPELTGRENILMNGLLMGFSKQEMMRREQRIIEFADIRRLHRSSYKAILLGNVHAARICGCHGSRSGHPGHG